MRTGLLALGLLVCAGGLGLAVHAAPGRRLPGESQGVLALLLGEARFALGNRLFLQADRYFHGGVFVAPGTEEQEVTPGTRGSGREAGTGGGAAARPAAVGESRVGEPAVAAWDLWTRLNRSIRPYDHRHLTGERYEKEILPWLWAATVCNPHDSLGFEVAGYWLARRLQRPAEGLRLVEEGIRHCPDSPELEFTRGEILLLTMAQPERAVEAFQQADRKWRSLATVPGAEPDILLHARTLLYLGDIRARQGDWESAQAYYQEVLPIAGNREVVEAALREVRARLAAGQSQVGGDARP